MYDYRALEKFLEERNLHKSDLTRLLNISSRTIAKISKGEKISNSVLKKLSNFLVCENEQLYRIVSENEILQVLRDEKNHKVSGGFYHELQIRMTYNSNRIEGSTLTEDQTRRIFETNTIGGGNNISVDDIIETTNHFIAIDYCIDIAEEPLSEDIIKKLHLLLKSGTRDEALDWFKAGDYKIRPNMVGGEMTTPPENVHREIAAILSSYNSNEKIIFEDIVKFHFEFEKIHPFQDGNGRVGRLIAFKECLKHNIVPFIIEDRKKYFYYRGLKEFPKDEAYLIDTCYDGQDTFKSIATYFRIDTTNLTKDATK